MKSQPHFFFRCAFQHSLRATEKKKQFFFSAFMVRFSLEDHFFRLISTLQERFNQELHCLIPFRRALIDWFSLSLVIWQVTGIKDKQSPYLVSPCSMVFTPALAKLLFKISLKKKKARAYHNLLYQRNMQIFPCSIFSLASHYNY